MYETISSREVGIKWVRYEFRGFGHLRSSNVYGMDDNRPRLIVGEDAPKRDEVGSIMPPNEENEFAKGQIVWVRSGQGRTIITHSERKEILEEEDIQI